MSPATSRKLTIQITFKTKKFFSSVSTQSSVADVTTLRPKRRTRTQLGLGVSQRCCSVEVSVMAARFMKCAQGGFLLLVSSFVQICFLLEYLQIYSFLSVFPLHLGTTQQQQTNIFPLFTETFQTSLSNNTYSGANKTKQNCRPHLA
jgi:hypothetical protein